MEKNNEGFWLEELLLEEQLSGLEQLWRNIGRLADTNYLMIKITRYPLTSDLQQYVVYIATYKDKKWSAIYKYQGMILKEVLQKIEKYLIEYDKKHKKYDLGKRGMGGYI